MAWQDGTGTSRGFPTTARRIILARDPTCQCTGCPDHTHKCGRPSTDADHITRPIDGGTDDPTNGRGLCRRCHMWRTQAQARAARRRQGRPADDHPGLTQGRDPLPHQRP